MNPVNFKKSIRGCYNVKPLLKSTYNYHTATEPLEAVPQQGFSPIFYLFRFYLSPGSLRRVHVIRFKTKRNSNGPVNQQENGPDYQENNCIRQHHRDQRANACVFHIPLTEHNHQREIWQQRCDNI